MQQPVAIPPSGISPVEVQGTAHSASECMQRAAAAHRQNRLAEAIAWAQQAAALEPAVALHHYTVGRLHGALGNVRDEVQALREALRLRPDFVDAWTSLGIRLRLIGELGEAESCQRQALQHDPANFAATLNLGNVLLSGERPQEALQCFQRAVELNPASAEAHNNLGHVLFNLREFDGPASHHLLKALELNPNYFEAALCLGKAQYRLSSLEGAIRAFARAVMLRPGDFESRGHLARCYYSARRFDEAVAEYERLVREFDGRAEARSGLAATLSAMGQYKRPKELFELAIKADPDNPSIRFDYALFLLRSGDFAAASRYHESRWQADHIDQMLKRDWPQPMWDGTPLDGRRLLITSEQGLGDEIMFASIFGEIIAEASHCIIESNQRLEKLFRRSFPSATVCGIEKKGFHWHRTLGDRLAELPQFDCWIPAGTLMTYRRKSPESFPSHSGYLVADAERKAHWQQRLADLGPGLKVGISWRGGTVRTRAAVRSMSLASLRPLLGIEGAQFINLQYGDCAQEISDFATATGIRVHHWQEAIDDYDETAALVSSLDLVISVCTSVIHLGGALGRPVWVMAPHVAEWRYGWQGERMVWYPTVKVFRQSRTEQWQPLIAEVGRALSRAIANPVRLVAGRTATAVS